MPALYQVATFGSAKTGLTTVGYRLYRYDNVEIGSRVSVGISELSPGQYGALVTYPDGFRGRITWDTGESPPIYATASVNLELQAGDDHSGDPGSPGITVAGAVEAVIPERDNCPILTRLKAFVVDQGVQAILLHTMRDRRGLPVDLSNWLAAPVSLSSSVSYVSPIAGSVKIRVKEWLGEGMYADRNPIWEQTGDPVSPERGQVMAQLTSPMVEYPGIYEVNWAVVNDADRPVLVDRSIMSVERSLFPVNAETLYDNSGPPTLQDIRMMLMDSHRNDNTLLDDVEFGDEQIMLALTLPIRQWNETPPPIERYTTRNFPFRGAWMTGALAQLHKMAAAHYRRNFLQTSGGGVTVADKAKEREYLTEAKRLQDEYDAWLINKKVELNMKKFVGQSRSAYSGRGGW